LHSGNQNHNPRVGGSSPSTAIVLRFRRLPGSRLSLQRKDGMTIAIGSDHRGFNLKNALRTWLEREGHEVSDVGTESAESCDYPDYALGVARKVAGGEAELGILICGTGIGMSMAAGKVAGIRAARVCTSKDAEMAHRHNNANVLCFGADTGVDETLARRIIQAWMDAEFEGGRHQRRVGKITAYEQRTAG